ncbi:unnamed protein product [Linum trigynum]|uniref:Uncharacterized protein n=1 Tax=Linum trigynum TaxID=586398 RepID=A0AAV2EX08_9ROSI
MGDDWKRNRTTKSDLDSKEMKTRRRRRRAREDLIGAGRRSQRRLTRNKNFDLREQWGLGFCEGTWDRKSFLAIIKTP